MNRDDIARLIPHSGAMCLLDEVASWDANRIRCVARTHRSPGNPLRANGRLPAICGIEYAGQAMALHGGLTGRLTQRPRAGYLASVRDVVCRVDCLDTGAGDLCVDAELLMGDEAHVVYRFALSCGNLDIVSGRATVALDADRGKA